MTSQQKQSNLEDSGETSLKDRNKCQSIIIYSAKNMFHKSETKAFSEMQQLKEFITSIPCYKKK